jgi:hypothetical protein
LAVTDNTVVDFAAKKNLEVANKLLATTKITPIAQQFYYWQ